MEKRQKNGKRIRKEAKENRGDLGKSKGQMTREGKASGNPKAGRMLDVKG